MCVMFKLMPVFSSEANSVLEKCALKSSFGTRFCSFYTLFQRGKISYCWCIVRQSLHQSQAGLLDNRHPQLAYEPTPLHLKETLNGILVSPRRCFASPRGHSPSPLKLFWSPPSLCIFLKSCDFFHWNIFFFCKFKQRLSRSRRLSELVAGGGGSQGLQAPQIVQKQLKYFYTTQLCSRSSPIWPGYR